MWIVKAALKNPYAVSVLVFLILVLGLIATTNIPVDILPVFKAPAVEVLTYYQGMPAASVEKTITNRLERWVNQAPGAFQVESKSILGVSVVKIYFRDDIDPNGALTLTSSLALGALPTLPPNTLPPVVLPFDPTGTLPLGILTVSNPSLDEAHVKDLARIDVRNMLGAVPGSVSPVVVGGQDRTVMVYLKPDRLEARRLSPLDVVEALRKGNLMASPGTLYLGNQQLLLDTNAMPSKVEDFKTFPIPMAPRGGDPGSPNHVDELPKVYLEDVADVQDASAIQTSRVRINGKSQVYVPIYRQGGASSLAVANGVLDYIPSMQDRLPKGTVLKWVMDQSVYVREAILSLIHEGIIGAGLVAVMILLFLGNVRLTMIAVFSIPLAILSSIIGLFVTGNTINAMTLGGLALAIGPLVDDAIVVLENTHRHHSLGKSAIRAAFDGAVEVTVPVLVATLTTIIVLCPLALMPGISGFLFKPLTLAVAFAMLSSFVLSRTFVPTLCAKWLGGQVHPSGHHPPTGVGGRLHRRIELGLSFLTQRYERLLHHAMNHRVMVLALVGLLFVGSLCLTFGIGREFFPQVDAGQITLYVRATSRENLGATTQQVAKVEQFLQDNIPDREREMIVSEIGLNPDWSAAYTANSGQQDAVIRVQLSERRALSAQEYAIKLRRLWKLDARTRELGVSFDTGGMVSTALNYGASSPIDIQLEARGDPDRAERLAKDICERVKSVRGAADVRVLQRRDAPTKLIKIDRESAMSVGLTAYDVVMQVVAAFNSSISINRNFWIDTVSGNQYFVAVQFPEDPHRKLDDLLNVFATGTYQNKPVKLSSLVTLVDELAPVEINHSGLTPIYSILVNTEDRALGSVASDIERKLAQVKVPAGMKIELRGEYQRMNESARRLATGMALAAVLVYLLMVPLFRSFLGPLIIMFTVPLGLMGVLAMLYVTRTTLNVQSEMGVIFLVGIVVSNGVLLVDFANRQRKLGVTVRKAITAAAAVRFRPILMTFLATFLDLVPMAIGLGKGSEANVPLARAVVGGLLSSTCLTLFVVPILYSLLIRESVAPEIDLDQELSGGMELQAEA